MVFSDLGQKPSNPNEHDLIENNVAKWFYTHKCIILVHNQAIY
jgi:hypothetical protein